MVDTNVTASREVVRDYAGLSSSETCHRECKRLYSSIKRVCGEPTLCAGYFLFVLLIFIFGFSFYVYVVISCVRWILPRSVGLCVLYLVLFCPPWLLLVISYFRACFANPGVIDDSVVRGERPDVESVMRPESRMFGSNTFCSRCSRVKPERAHHCSICGHCVLRLDHHCPYVLGDVGFYNHKFFYLLLFWADITCIVVVSCMMQTLVLATQTIADVFKRSQPFILQDEILLCIVMAIALIVLLLLIPFTFFHTSLILKNKTTIESFNDKRFRTRFGEFVHPYDIGRRKNWDSVMGERWWVWFLPVRAYISNNGLTYPKHPDLDDPTLIGMSNVSTPTPQADIELSNINGHAHGHPTGNGFLSPISLPRNSPLQNIEQSQSQNTSIDSTLPAVQIQSAGGTVFSDQSFTEKHPDAET